MATFIVEKGAVVLIPSSAIGTVLTQSTVKIHKDAIVMPVPDGATQEQIAELVSKAGDLQRMKRNTGFRPWGG